MFTVKIGYEDEGKSLVTNFPSVYKGKEVTVIDLTTETVL